MLKVTVILERQVKAHQGTVLTSDPQGGMLQRDRCKNVRYNVSTPAGCSANCHSHKAGILGLPREAHGGGQPSAPEKSLTKNRRTDSLCTTTHRELKHPVMFSFPLFEVLGLNKHPLYAWQMFTAACCPLCGTL